jgi:hypothetical protein
MADAHVVVDYLLRFLQHPAVNVTGVIALFLSYRAWRIAQRASRRAERAEVYDYAVRLQVRVEEPGLGVLRTPQALYSYSAAIVNVGLKPVRIEHIYIDYGGETFDTSWHRVVDGRSDVPPQGERHIAFELRVDDYEETLKKFNITKLFVRLRVEYVDVEGKVVEAERPLIAFDPQRHPISYFQRGDALT